MYILRVQAEFPAAAEYHPTLTKMYTSFLLIDRLLCHLINIFFYIQIEI